MREQGHRAAGRFRRRMGVWAPLVFVCVAGCGYELYEQRLENTKILFAHMDLLNQHLQGAWEDGGTGISLRVPMQFTLLAPPAKTPAAPDKKAAPADGQEADESDEDETEEILDDRQPKYMNVFLPGLRGAFQAGLKIATETNTLVDGDGYLYVMTNHELAEEPEEAKKFYSEFVRSLGDAVHESVDESTESTEKFPTKPGTFVKPISYRYQRFAPNSDLGGLRREFRLYLYEQGDVQVLVLFVLPEDVDSSERMTERIPLCLETLTVGGNRLVRPGTGPAAGGGVPGQGF